MSKYSTSNSSARDSLALAISFGVCSSMKSFSIQYVRSACSNVVWMRKMRFDLGWRRSRKRQSMRLSRLESAAIGVSGMAWVTTSRRGELDLDAAELDPLVVLELPGHGDEAALRQAGDGGGRLVVDDDTLGIRGARIDQLHRAGFVAQNDELHLLLVSDGFDPSGHGNESVVEGGKVLDQYASIHPASLAAQLSANSRVTPP